jgi:hypothetical protein
MPIGRGERLRRLVATAYLCLLEPVWRAWQLEFAFPRILVHGWPAAVFAAVQIVVAAAALVAGRAVLHADARAAVLGRVWAGTAIAVTLVTGLTPSFATGVPSERPLWLALSIGWYAVWGLIVARVPRVPTDSTETTDGEQK